MAKLHDDFLHDFLWPFILGWAVGVIGALWGCYFIRLIILFNAG